MSQPPFPPPSFHDFFDSRQGMDFQETPLVASHIQIFNCDADSDRNYSSKAPGMTGSHSLLIRLPRLWSRGAFFLALAVGSFAALLFSRWYFGDWRMGP